MIVSPGVGLFVVCLLLVALCTPQQQRLLVEAVVHPAIPCRNDLAIYAQDHFNKLGRAVEVGVFRGVFARLNVHHWKGEYYMVDAWAYRPHQEVPDKNYESDEENRQNYEAAKNAVKDVCKIDERCHLIKSLSVDAAVQFPDNYFDWIYVDALHTHRAVMEDLRAWYPKLRPGGLLSGDDYGDVENTYLMTKERWSKEFFPNLKRWQAYGWGVISAVNDFATEIDAQYFVTWSNDCYPYPAWYLIKPEAPQEVARLGQ